MEERLQKYLAAMGVASRRASEKLIADGRVRVNGKIVREMGTKVDPERDTVLVDGENVYSEERMVYIMLYKPAGYITSAHDPQNRPTVMDLVQEIPCRIFSVGRLDYDTEGLLLMTNDGDFAYRLTHPKFSISKVYRALVQGSPTEEQIEKLRNGIQLEDGMTKPAKVKVVRKENHKTLLEIQISEGRNRQIRRMCQAIHHPVLELKRTQIENVVLSKVKLGEYRELTKEELLPLLHKVQLGEK